MDDRGDSSESPTAANMDERLSRTVTSLDHLIGELSNTEQAIRRIVTRRQMQFNPTPDLPPIPEEADTQTATPANDINIDDHNEYNTSLNQSSNQNQSLPLPTDPNTTNEDEVASFMETMESLFQDRPLSELVGGFLRGRRSEGRQEAIGPPQNLPAAQPAASETPQQQENVQEEPLQTNDQTTTTQAARRPRQVVRNSRGRVARVSHGDDLLKEIVRSRERNQSLLRYNFIAHYREFSSERFRKYCQYFMIFYAILNIICCIMIKRYIRVDALGLRMVQKDSKSLEHPIYLALDFSNPPQRFQSNQKIDWDKQKCFSFTEFNSHYSPIDKKDLSSFDYLNFDIVLYAQKLRQQLPKFSLLSINPFCYKLHNRILQYFSKYYVGVFPIVNHHLDTNLNLRSHVYTYKPIYKSKTKFRTVVFNLFIIWMSYIAISAIKSFLTASIIDFILLSEKMNLNHSATLISLGLTWMCINIIVSTTIIASLWNHLETSVCINLAIGMIFHSLIINKASKVLWQFVFHLVNLTSVLIPLLQPDLHPKFFHMTFYSILVAVGFTLINTYDIPNLLVMSKYGYILSDEDD